MNNQVLEYLKHSSDEVKTIRKKKDAEKASMERFINKSRSNSTKLYRLLLEKAIRKYVEDPISILNFNSFVRDNNYEVSIPILNDRELQAVYGIRLSKKHNSSINSNSDKKRIVFYSEYGNNPTPVMISDLDNCSYKDNYIVANFSNKFIRTLLVNANIYIELYGKLYDKRLTTLLKSAFNEVKLKSDEMNEYLESIKKNAQIVYYDFYKRLLQEYRNNPNDATLWVFSEDKQSNPNRLIISFNEASENDAILFYSYSNEDGESVCVPVQMSVLRDMFNQDKSIGMKSFIFNKYYCALSFDTVLFENGLIKINEEEQNRRLQ